MAKLNIHARLWLRLPAFLLLSLVVALASTLRCARAQGLPEPGIIFYGTVTNTAGTSSLLTTNALWTVTNGATSLTLPATTIVVNGSAFYFVETPFETAIGGQPVSPGRFAMPVAPIPFGRAATVGGTNATILPPATETFSFGPSDRSRVDRVDLVVAGPVETFALWSQRFFGRPDADPNADPDGDGATNAAEFKAGTDPTSNQSVFRILDVKPDAQGGLVIRWLSTTNLTYVVERTIHLGLPLANRWSAVVTNAAQVGNTNSFSDPAATGPGPFFYRIRIE